MSSVVIACLYYHHLVDEKSSNNGSGAFNILGNERSMHLKFLSLYMVFSRVHSTWLVNCLVSWQNICVSYVLWIVSALLPQPYCT